MKTATATVLLFLFATLISECQVPAGILPGPPVSKMAVLVVDETGSPVSDAHVRAFTYWNHGGEINGFTDTNGLFHYTDRVSREIGYAVKKKGHYDSVGEAWWPKERFQIPTTNLVVELKRIIEPVELQLKEVGLVFPRLDEPVGFDFMVGDWVSPAGRGVVTDAVMCATVRWADKGDYDVNVSMDFPNVGDGIKPYSFVENSYKLKSDLQQPQRAFEGEYQRNTLFSSSSAPDTTRKPYPNGEHYIRHSSTYREDMGWVLRVRSKFDAEDCLVSAYHGCTLKDIAVGPQRDGSACIFFQYYFNPDPKSLSLEPREIACRQARNIPANPQGEGREE